MSIRELQSVWAQNRAIVPHERNVKKQEQQFYYTNLDTGESRTERKEKFPPIKNIPQVLGIGFAGIKYI